MPRYLCPAFSEALNLIEPFGIETNKCRRKRIFNRTIWNKITYIKFLIVFDDMSGGVAITSALFLSTIQLFFSHLHPYLCADVNQ